MSEAAAEAPQPAVSTGAPQTTEQLAEQAEAALAWAQDHHAELLEHVERTKVHVANMVAQEQDAADWFAANDLPAAQAAHEAAQAALKAEQARNEAQA